MRKWPVVVFLLGCSCTLRSNGQDDTHYTKALETESYERDAAASDPQTQLATETEAQLVLCEQQLEETRTALIKSEAAVAATDLGQSNSELKAQLAAAVARDQQANRLLQEAQSSLAVARSKLDSLDCEAALAELDDTRKLLTEIERQRGEAPGAMAVDVAFTFAGQPLQLDAAYRSDAGLVTFGGVRYWLSNIALVRDDDSTQAIPDSYYLMALQKEELLRGSSKAITLPARRRELVQLINIPPGSYKAISFAVGVDAVHNDDLSLSTGELSVMNNMAASAWMWFTSYIFTQLQASVVAADAQQDDGGVTAPTQVLWENGSNDDLRRVTLSLPNTLRVGADVHPTVKLALDASRLLDKLGSQLDSARAVAPAAPISNISASDAVARAQLADNWQAAFSASSVSYTAP
jgi:hypothetical protein